MKEPLFELARHAAADAAFMAHLVNQQAKRENKSWAELANELVIETAQLAKLALCHQPREAFFTQDVAQIAGYSGINQVVLLHLLDCAKQGIPLRKRSVQRTVPVIKREEKTFMLSQRAWATGLAALLLLVLGAFVMAKSGGTEATLVVSSGEVVVNQVGEALFAGSSDTSVPSGEIVTVTEGDTIRLGDTASAQLRLKDGSTVDLFGGTTLTIAELVTNGDSYRVQLTVFSGKILNRVVRLLKPDDTFEIRTPSSTASVRGTVFTVEALSTNVSTIVVTEGVVRVSLDDQFVDVQPGYQVTAVVGQPLLAVSLAEPTTRPTHTPEPTDEPTATSTVTATAVPTDDTVVPLEEDASPAGTPTQVPGNTPTEVPGNGNPPIGDATPPGQIDPGDTPASAPTATSSAPPTDTAVPAPTDTPVPAPTATSSSSDMVVICHNGNTIEVSTDAVAAHLAHGDQLGPCP